MRLVQAEFFFANSLFLYGNLWKLKRFSGSLSYRFEQPGAKHRGIFRCTHTNTRAHKKKTKNRQEKLEGGVLLRQLPTEVQRHNITLSGLARPGR